MYPKLVSEELEEKTSLKILGRINITKWTNKADRSAIRGLIKKLEQGYGCWRVGNTLCWKFILEPQQLTQMLRELEPFGCFTIKPLIPPLTVHLKSLAAFNTQEVTA